MGVAEIISGGPDGRYTIRLDFGEADRVAIIDLLATTSAQLDVKIASSEIAVAAADAREQAQLDILVVYADQYAFASQQDPPDLPTMDGLLFVYTEGLKQLRNIQAGNAQVRIADRKLRDAKAALLKRVAYYNNVDALEEREAWCADLTEDAEGEVATIDIPGENNLTIIVPTARPPAASDGDMRARELMSPSQAYFNAAILPGWQKDKPTYRWGTVTFLDEDTDLASVDLFDSTSSAQGLSVNQSPSLNGIPVQYMDCNAKVFKLNDRVVVAFANQNWEDPRVIGFVDTPRGCPPEFVPPIINLGAGNGLPFSENIAVFFTKGWKPLTYSLSVGTLPPGMTLDAETGVISGVSTATGVYPNLVLRCTDKAEKYDDSDPFSFEITPPWLLPISVALITGHRSSCDALAVPCEYSVRPITLDGITAINGVVRPQGLYAYVLVYTTQWVPDGSGGFNDVQVISRSDYLPYFLGVFPPYPQWWTRTTQTAYLPGPAPAILGVSKSEWTPDATANFVEAAFTMPGAVSFGGATVEDAVSGFFLIEFSSTDDGSDVFGAINGGFAFTRGPCY